MKTFALILNFLIFVAFLASAERTSAADLDDPGKMYSFISNGDYFTPLNILKSKESDYLKSPLKNSFVQVMATILSYTGRYDEAQQYFDSVFSKPNTLELPSDFSLFYAENAVRAIVKESQYHSVLMINEAHHVPETRILTTALLKPLYKRGFRYLAAETFSSDGILETLKKGMPVRATGFYTADPVFSNLVREALKVGYKLVPYEYEENCDYQTDSKGCQDRRERGQARNLVDRILKFDPTAKILVHAGYGHIDKLGGSSSFPWIPMAKYFKEFSGIEPYSINQIDSRSRSRTEVESQGYRKLVEHFQVSSPIVLVSKNSGKLWSAFPGHYDAEVILPPRFKDNSYQPWMLDLLEMKKVSISSELCDTFSCLIQAFLISEIKEKAIPINQIYLELKKNKVDLPMKSGKYELHFISSAGLVKRRISVK